MRLRMILERVLRLFGREGHEPPRAGPDEVCALLIDPFAGDLGEGTHGGSVPVEAIRTACRRMQGAATKGELLHIIAGEVGVFDLHDLELMNAGFERKVESLPEDYRDRLLASVREEIFGTHHRLVLLSRNGAGPGMDGPPGPAHSAYWAMVAEACTEKAREKDPKYLYLKYLLSGFAMFVLTEPAHPVGTPFPGGRSSTSGRGPTSARSGIWPTMCLSPSAPTARRSRAWSRLSRRCGPAAWSGEGGKTSRTTGLIIKDESTGDEWYEDC
nr:DUF2115 family protein [Methanoculleus bourgensis]